MFFELIGTIVAGVATALFVWAINRALKGRLPGWIVPVSAGAAMLIATISSEYGWFARSTANMPQGFVVAQSIEETAFYRPWTYVKPFVSRFVAVDQATVKTNPDFDSQRIVELVFYGRWARTSRVPMLFDCAVPARADIADGIEFASDGSIQNAAWISLPEDDPVLEAACSGG